MEMKFVINFEKSNIEELLKFSRIKEKENFYYKLQESILRIW